jgi:hypothetical protein
VSAILSVMAGLVPAIHVLGGSKKKDVGARDKPGHDDFTATYLLPGSEIVPLATSRFQMNSTTSAPMVAVMKPAPWFGP